MQNLLILYNPYYNQEMIEDHIRILNKAENPNNAKVAFGKIRSKMRDYDNSGQEVLDSLFSAVSSTNPMQLFLTDFSSMYVCYVEKVSQELNGVEAPKYYENLDVESWFVVSDMREIIRNNFEYVREQVLVQFTTPTYRNHLIETILLDFMEIDMIILWLLNRRTLLTILKTFKRERETLLEFLKVVNMLWCNKI